MRIEYSYTVEIAERLPAGKLTKREQARLQRLMNAEIERIVAEELFGAYFTPRIEPVRSCLGVITRDAAVS